MPCLTENLSCTGSRLRPYSYVFETHSFNKSANNQIARNIIERSIKMNIFTKITPCKILRVYLFFHYSRIIGDTILIY